MEGAEKPDLVRALWKCLGVPKGQRSTVEVVEGAVGLSSVQGRDRAGS